MADRDVDSPTDEFSGVTRDNTILAKPPGSIPIPWEKLRLMHLTGEPEDVTSKPDRRIWLGQDNL